MTNELTMLDTVRELEKQSGLLEPMQDLVPRGRGLRGLFCPVQPCQKNIKRNGSILFPAALEEKLLLARYFHEKIQAINGIETGLEPDLSIVIFRYVPKGRALI